MFYSNNHNRQNGAKRKMQNINYFMKMMLVSGRMKLGIGSIKIHFNYTDLIYDINSRDFHLFIIG